MAKRTFQMYRPRKAIVDLYDVVKYHAEQADFDREQTINYSGLTAFDIVDGDDAWEIEDYTDDSTIDDFHEYLVLHFENGDTATFRNSYCDLFVI